MNKILRFLVIFCFGVALVLGASYFLIHHADQASATIYWESPGVRDSFFLGKLGDLGYNATFGGPITMNGSNGHFVIYQANATVQDTLKQLKKHFAQLSPEDIHVKEDAKTGFFVAECGQKTCAWMLIRDDNINKTWLFTIIMPTELFHRTKQLFMDENGSDPVAELRPPGSTRVFCFETPALTFAAYKSIDGDLTDFYESAFDDDEIRGVSIMAFSENKLPNNGNLFFFDTSLHKGFVVFQNEPKDNYSYSIVCAQTQ